MKLLPRRLLSLSFVASQRRHPSFLLHPSPPTITSPPPTHHIHITTCKMASTKEDETLIEKERAKSAFVYTESIAPGLDLGMALHSILHSSVSEFQEVQVIDTYFGRTLVTDGKTQSAAHDEFVYHESLVHPPLLWNAMLNGSGGGAPKRVFIGGGGELATAREVLRHNTIEKVVMVDIDPAVIEVCKQYLPEWGGTAVSDHPKMELIIGDAHKYLMETTDKFDAIVMDISDPIEAGPGIALYTKEFYERAAQVLNKHGVFVTQAGGANFVPHPHETYREEEEDNKESSCFAPIMNTLLSAFDHAVPYSVPIASFGEDWGFVVAYNGSPENGNAKSLPVLDAGTIDAWIDERIEAVPGVLEHKVKAGGVKRSLTGKEKGGDVLKHYDGVAHRGMFALSKPLRRTMAKDRRIMTKANPIYMY